MTRSVALRASVCFVVLTILFGAVGLGSYSVAAEAGFLIAAALVAVLALFAAAAPAPQAIPVRVRRDYRRDARR